MKRAVSLLLVGLLVFSIVACGSSSEKDQVETNVEMPQYSDSNQESAEQILENEEEPITQTEPSATEIPVATPTPATEDNEKAFSLEGTIEETVLVDEKGIKITATDLTFGKNGVELSFLLENNTEQDLRFMAGTLGYSCNFVNGYMVDTGSVSTTIPAGKKSREIMRFNYDTLELYGIKNVAEIGVGFMIDDADNYKQLLKTEPLIITTSLAATYDYSREAFETTITEDNSPLCKNGTIDYSTRDDLYKNGDFVISSAALWTRNDGDQYLLLEFENNSTETVRVSVSDISINDVEVCYSTWTGVFVSPNKKAIIDISLSLLLDDPEYLLLGLKECADFSSLITVEDKNGKEINSEEMVIDLSNNAKWDPNQYDQVYEGEGITIYSLGLMEDKWAHSNDLHLYLLIKNNTNGLIRADVKDGSISIDGFVVDELSFGEYISSGKYGVLDVEVQGDSLEKNGFFDIEDIKDLEIQLEIKNENYRTIVQPKIILEFK